MLKFYSPWVRRFYLSKLPSKDDFVRFTLPFLSAMILSACGASQIVEDLSSPDVSGVPSRLGVNNSEDLPVREVRTLSGQVLKADPDCGPDSNGNYSEQTLIQSSGVRTLRVKMSDGTEREIAPNFALGGGCVNRPIREVWAASLNWPAMQWNGSGKATVQQINSRDLDDLLSFDVRHEVVVGIIPISWTLSWNHFLRKGTTAEPNHVIIRFNKSAGTGFITRWKGRIDFQQLSPNVTSFGLEVELLAQGKDIKDATQEIFEYHDKIKRVAPNWDALSAI